MKTPASLKVAIREWQMMIKSPTSRILIFWIPLIVFTLLAGIYSAGTLRKVPVAVLDQDHSNLSRTLITYLNASPDTKVTTYVNSEEQLKDFFLHHTEKAIYCFPHGLEKDVLKGKSTEVNVLTNSTNIIYGNILKRNAYRLIETVSGGVLIRKLTAQGLTPRQARHLALPIAVNAKPLFNPEYNYLYYLVPGLLTVLLQMIVFFMGARSINTEYKAGNEEELLETANHRIINIIIGKLLVYTSIGMVIALFISILFAVFGIPYQNNIGAILFLFFLFILASGSLGMMLSALVPEEIVALDIALFYNSSAFIFSGFTFPVMGMPLFDSLWAQFIPYTHFLGAFFKLSQMGTSLAFAQDELLILAAFILVGFFTTYLALSLKMKNNIHSEIILTKA